MDAAEEKARRRAEAVRIIAELERSEQESFQQVTRVSAQQNEVGGDEIEVEGGDAMQVDNSDVEAPKVSAHSHARVDSQLIVGPSRPFPFAALALFLNRGHKEGTYFVD